MPNPHEEFTPADDERLMDLLNIEAKRPLLEKERTEAEMLAEKAERTISSRGAVSGTLSG